MTTLIFGCGYLGQRVRSVLRQTGERVLGTVRSPARAAHIESVGIEPIIADVLEPSTLRGLPAIERILYCVGYDRAAAHSMRTTYVDGLQNVLDALPGSVTRFVYASSTGVYGQTGGAWVDEGSPTDPQHESGQVCLEAEHRLSAWAGDRSPQGLAIVLRFAGLYGPGRVVRRALLERGEPIPGDPDKFLNLIHIDDAARAATAALGIEMPDPIFAIADDRPVARREYYGQVATILGLPQPRFQPPSPGSIDSARDQTSKRVANRRMKARLIASLNYPDINSGLPAALDPGQQA